MRTFSVLVVIAIVCAAGLLVPAVATGATFVVTNTSDSGDGSLRQAIQDSNAAVPGPNLIQFNIAGSGVQTIAPTSFLPFITTPVTIDGYSQPGSSPNTLATGNNAILLIELNGASAGESGLTVLDGGTTIRGLVINRFGNSGIFLFAPGGNVITGNYIGTNALGTAPLGNFLGVMIFTGASNNTVGGPAPAARNVISGNSLGGIHIEGGSNLILGNYIGTNASGTAAIPNGYGIEVITAGNTIGGSIGACGGPCNLISGNSTTGIRLDSGPSQEVVIGNHIGTDVTGTAPLGNGGEGISICFGSSNTIGGPAGEGNRIAFNGGDGIRICGGTGNSIGINSIHSNSGLGIDLNDDGPTPNDSCDGDGGANNSQNSPVVTMVTSVSSVTSIAGTLDSAPGTYMLHFYSNQYCDPTGVGEGRAILGTTMVTVGPSCSASFNVVLPISVFPRESVTATATDSAGNSSEHSACFVPPSQYHTIDPCRLADTRGPDGLFGGPAIAGGGVRRSFLIILGCGIPDTARAVAFNFTVTQPTAQGDLRIFPAGGEQPVVSTLNYRANQTRANNAILTLGPNGAIDVVSSQPPGTTTHLIIDVVGYFE